MRARAQVDLHQRDQRAIDHAHRAEDRQHPIPFLCRLRQQWDDEAQEPVGTDLDADEEHAHADDRSLLQYFWHPGVQWKQRRLDGEAQTEDEENQCLYKEILGTVSFTALMCGLDLCFAV